jgi:hypothetical protein
VLGGGAYAATALPKNSVGSAQLKSKAVTPPKVAPKTIQLFKGQKGTPGATNVTAREKSESVPVACTPQGSPPSTYYTCNGGATVVAACESGERATGGSYVSPSIGASDAGPTPTSGTPTGWFATVQMNNQYSAAPISSIPVTVRVVCARP